MSATEQQTAANQVEEQLKLSSLATSDFLGLTAS